MPLPLSLEVDLNQSEACLVLYVRSGGLFCLFFFSFFVFFVFFCLFLSFLSFFVFFVLCEVVFNAIHMWIVIIGRLPTGLLRASPVLIRELTPNIQIITDKIDILHNSFALIKHRDLQNWIVMLERGLEKRK